LFSSAKPETLEAPCSKKARGGGICGLRLRLDLKFSTSPAAGLSLAFPGGPPIKLDAITGPKFRDPEFRGRDL